MPLNVPTVTKANITWGPAVLFIGAPGSTPVNDVGAISEDGITAEITSENREIAQGNPRIPEFMFSQAQGVRVQVTSIEWNLLTSLPQALGAGNTTSGGGVETFAWGGEPCLTEVALRIQHQMCESGDTIDWDIWKAVSDGGFSVPMGQDEHPFEYAWKGLRTDTNWAGAGLPNDEQLFLISRTT